ncbi:MAG: tetratricopeptide repeat protein [Bdellovibrionales bacterium]|nr:tetratricopeptide repeat protein [Bdellovibrionales bacterium]
MKRLKVHHILTITKATVVGLLVGVNLFSSLADEKKPVNVLQNLQYSTKDAESDADIKSLKTEMLVKKVEKNAILQLKKLIRKHRGSALEVEFLHRLGELYMRRAKGDKNIELHRHSDYSVSVAPKLIKTASSKQNMLEAVEIFTKIQRKHKNFPRMDLVVFNSAFANHLLENKKEAERLYWKLIKTFPDSSLVPDSHLAIGEMAFNQKRFQFALKHFEAVKKYPNSRVYPYSVYKAGWAKYNLRDEMGAIKEMEEVVRFGKYIHDNNIDARLDLRREALADMTIFYEDVYPARDAYKYFKTQSGELDVAPTLYRLSRIYERHSRHDDRRTVLDLVIEHIPTAKILPDIYEAHVDNYEQMRNRKKSVVKIIEFNSICIPESKWSVAQEQNEKGERPLVSQCLSQLKDLSLKMAQKWLRLWNKNQHHSLFADVSEQAFEIFLLHDSQDERANKARVAYSDLLFKRGKFRKASENYAVVGSRGAVKGSLGHDSRYAALLSLEKAVKDKWSDEDEKTFHDLAESYVKNHPKGKYLLDVEFKKGLIAYEKSKYEEAAKVFLVIGDQFGHEIKGKKAQDLYLDILNLKKDYKGLVAYSNKLIKSTKSPIRVKKLKEIFEQSSLLQIQAMEESGKWLEAAQSYQKFSVDNPSSKLAAESWWNSVELLYKAKKDSQGAAAAMSFYKKYPDEKNVLNGLFRAAKTYEELLELEQAADVLEILVKKDKKSSLKWLSLAADFRFLSNDLRKAKVHYKDLSQKNDPTLAAHALEQLALISENHGQFPASTYENLIKLGVEPQASIASLKELEAIQKKGNESDTFIAAKKVLGRSGAPAFVKAKARFIQAEILENEFVRQSVKSNVERISMVLSIKTEKLEKAQRAYQAAISYGDGEIAVQSLLRLAGCYSHYSSSLNTMPVPAGLPESEVTSFKSEIGKLAIPIEEKGIETLNRALSEAKRLKLRDGQIAKIQKKIDSINLKKSRSSMLAQISIPEMALPIIKEAQP